MDWRILRECVVAEAYSFLSTPYHHRQWVKGKNGGVDCMTMVAMCYMTVGIIPAEFDPGFYSKDWNLHKRTAAADTYLKGAEKFGRRREPGETPEIADLALYKIGHCVSHGGIVVGENLLIHANGKARCVELTTLDGELAPYFHSFWSPVFK